MKVSKSVKIEAAAAKNDARYQLCSVMLDCEEAQPKLVATDGHILAVVPVEATKEEAGPLPADIFREARKLAKKDNPVEITCNGFLALTNGAQYPRPALEGRFPTWRAVFPKPSAKPIQVCINVDLLSRLSDALGSESVVLTIDPEHLLGAIHVQPREGENRPNVGLLMPIALPKA